MSGPASAAQAPWGLGFQSAIRAVNGKGGVNGRSINVLAEDTRYDPTVEHMPYEKYVNQTPALGTSGMGNSSAQTAMVPVIKRSKLPVVGAYTTAKASVVPTSPYFYGGFCGFEEMTRIGVGFFIDHLKLTAPKVALMHLDVASGQEYANYITARGGTVKALPIKVVAADATR